MGDMTWTFSPLRKAALLAVAASLAAAAPAAADSISYLKDGDIWLTTPDGGRQFRVTSSGDYTYASQADDGRFVARLASSERLHLLDRFGTVLADFATPVSDGPTPPGGSANHFEGPYDPEISPDGTRVAYSYFWQHYTYDPTGCGGTGCLAQRLESGTAITHADRLTPWDEFGHLTGWQEPSWASNDQLVRSNAGVALSENVVVNRIAPGLGDDDLVRWVKEAYTDERRDAEVDRGQTKLALVDEVAGPAGSFTTIEGIRVYAMPDRFAAAPVGCFRWGGDDSQDRFHSPTWSPDGSRLAFEENGALMVLPVPDLSGAGCGVPETGAAKVLDGASQPDWGPADVPTARPATGGGGPAGGGSGGGATPGGGPAAPGAPAPSGGAALQASAKRVSLAAALRSGLKVRVTAPGAGRLTVTVKRAGKVVARGTATAKAAGARTVTARFSAAGRRALRRVPRAALKAGVTYAPGTGAPVKTVVAVTLKR